MPCILTWKRDSIGSLICETDAFAFMNTTELAFTTLNEEDDDDEEEEEVDEDDGDGDDDDDDDDDEDEADLPAAVI